MSVEDVLQKVAQVFGELTADEAEALAIDLLRYAKQARERERSIDYDRR